LLVIVITTNASIGGGVEEEERRLGKGGILSCHHQCGMIMGKIIVKRDFGPE
jgi:hypothetical protein